MSHGIPCPSCGSIRCDVKDSRRADGAARRRRVCVACGYRFSTWERLEAPARYANIDVALKKVRTLSETAVDIVAFLELMKKHQPGADA